MNQVKKLQNLKNLSYFNKNALSQLMELTDNTLYSNITRWLASGDLIQLKKGLYVTRHYLSAVRDITAYTEFIANRLREPSYLSLEYVLQKHSILTEAVYAVTSITMKNKRVYKNEIGTYAYRNINEKLFVGYEIKESGIFEIKEATKAKALFDFLYLKTYRMRSIDKSFIVSLRLNLDEFSRKDYREFKGYCKLAGIKKLGRIADLIGEQCDY